MKEITRRDQRNTNRSFIDTGFLFVAGFLAYFLNHVYMIMLPLYIVENGGTFAQAGLQGTTFIACAIVLRFWSGPFADKLGVKPVMATGLLAFAASSPLMILCDQFWQVLLLRCLQSVGLATFFPCATAAIAQSVPKGHSGKILGAYRFVSSAALMIGPPTALAIVKTQGYCMCFCVLGLCAATALGLVALSNIPRSKNGSTADIDPKTPSQKTLSLMRDVLSRNKQAMAFALGATFVAALSYGLLASFATPYLSAIRPSENAGLFFTIIGMTGLLASPLAGWASDHTGAPSLTFGLLSTLGFGVGFLALAPFSSCFAWISSLLVGFGYFGAITCVLSLLAKNIEQDYQSSALSLQQNGIDLGIACANGLFGSMFAVLSLKNAFAVFAIWGLMVAICGIVAFCKLHTHRQQSTPPSAS